jgi:hypothetical protein
MDTGFSYAVRLYFLSFVRFVSEGLGSAGALGAWVGLDWGFSFDDDPPWSLPLTQP